MYSVIIEAHILEKIRTYADILLDGYLLRFSDTGMWEAEAIIKDNYIQAAYLLVDSIYDNISKVMPHEILPYTALADGVRETSIRLGARRLFIQYEEDASNMTRYITDIEIIRR